MKQSFFSVMLYFIPVAVSASMRNKNEEDRKNANFEEEP